MITVEFASSGSNVRGYFYPSPNDSAIATVLFLQGFPGTEGDELICERLAQANVNVLTFNYRGTFQSEGYFTFSSAVADIGAALQFLKGAHEINRHPIDTETIVLGGWSFGSGIVLAGAAQHPNVKKIFAISGRDFSKEARRIAQDPDYAAQVATNLDNIRAPKGPVHIKDDIISDLINNQITFDIEKLTPSLKDRDILLIGGWDDSIVAIEEHILPLYRILVAQKTKTRIEAFQDDHEFSANKDRLVQVIVNWLSETIDRYVAGSIA